jgi:hypothetical protein
MSESEREKRADEGGSGVRAGESILSDSTPVIPQWFGHVTYEW